MRDPREKTAARALDVEVGVAAVGEISSGEPIVCPFLGGWRLSCKAFARAFSCVRTKCARFLTLSVQHMDLEGSSGCLCSHLDKDLPILRIHFERYMGMFKPVITSNQSVVVILSVALLSDLD